MPEAGRRLPALIFCDPNRGSLKIAGLTLLDRLVVAMHRAGCQPISIICQGQVPSIKRSRALGIAPNIVDRTDAVSGPVLMAEANLLVQADDVRAVVAGKGRLSDANGARLDIGCLSRPEPNWKSALDSQPEVRARGVAGEVQDAASAKRMAKGLWKSLASSSDGVVDKYFNRPLGQIASRLLVSTPVTPNMITVFSALIGIISACFFAQGTWTAGIIGAVLLQVSALVDCIDGDIARVAFKESPLGKWLDISLDQVVHIAVFGAIGAGLWRMGYDKSVVWLGGSAVLGTIISFPVVLRARALADRMNDSRLERLMDAASTRDFTALVLILAVLEKLHWFLWLTGITVHLFWMTTLLLLFSKRHRNGGAATGRA